MITLKLPSIQSHYLLSTSEYKHIWGVIFRQIELQCIKHNVTINEFYGNYKDKNTVIARRVVLEWIRSNLVFEMTGRNARLGYYNSEKEQYKLPYPLLGHLFNKDHSTIIEMEKRIKKNDSLRH